MIARGNPSWRKGEPILGRHYASPKEPSIMAKAKAAWEGLAEDRPSGTYIRPHTDGTYEFGRWWHSWLGHYRFEHMGDRSTREACKAALVEADNATLLKADKLRRRPEERRAKQLNKRRRA